MVDAGLAGILFTILFRSLHMLFAEPIVFLTVLNGYYWGILRSLSLICVLIYCKCLTIRANTSLM